jgi:RNA polymerase sigma-70 factor (ECF subfamily)
MDEAEAIRRLKQGDLAGLETLVHSYQEKALAAAYLIVRDRPLAEDVVQSAFLRAAERITQFDEARPFGPWFLRSVTHAALDEVKRQRRSVSMETTDPGEAVPIAEWLASGDPRLEELVENAETRRAVRDALDQLTPEQRAAVVLRYYLGLKETEMTGPLRRPLSTVKWWLRVARSRLRELLNPFRSTQVWEGEEEKSHG